MVGLSGCVAACEKRTGYKVSRSIRHISERTAGAKFIGFMFQFESRYAVCRCSNILRFGYDCTE